MYAFTKTIYIQLEDTVHQDPFDFCTESARKPMIYDSGLWIAEFYKP